MLVTFSYAMLTSCLAAGLAGPTQPAAFDGGSVRDAMSAALAAGMPGGSGTDGGMGSQHVAPWYPRGVLVAHLAEHRKCAGWGTVCA